MDHRYPTHLGFEPKILFDSRSPPVHTNSRRQMSQPKRLFEHGADGRRTRYPSKLYHIDTRPRSHCDPASYSGCPNKFLRSKAHVHTLPPMVHQSQPNANFIRPALHPNLRIFSWGFTMQITPQLHKKNHQEE